MNGNSLGVVLSPGGLAGAERSEGERSEPQRSAAPAKAGADSVTRARPDPEVVAKPKRRTYTAEYTLAYRPSKAQRDGAEQLLITIRLPPRFSVNRFNFPESSYAPAKPRVERTTPREFPFYSAFFFPARVNDLETHAH